MNGLVTLVNSNQVKPAVAPIAFDYLWEPLVSAGFTVDLLDLCFAENFRQAIRDYCVQKQPSFWGLTMRNTDDVYFSSQHSFVDKVRDMIACLRRHSSAPVAIAAWISESSVKVKFRFRCS